jgi:hypothetical protein
MKFISYQVIMCQSKNTYKDFDKVVCASSGNEVFIFVEIDTQYVIVVGVYLLHILSRS